MELYIYDRDLELKGVIDEIDSLIWTRRYNECGDFKLLVPFTSLNASLLIKNNIIMKKGDDEAGHIAYIKIKKDVKGLEVIEVQGRLLTFWLDTRILLNQIVMEDTTENIICKIVNDNAVNPIDVKRRLPFVVGEYEEMSGLISYTSELFLSVLAAIEDLAKAEKIGFKIVTDRLTKTHELKIYKGVDRTSTQIENSPCIFSREFENIYEQEYENSIESYKSLIYVGAEIVNGEDRQVVEVGEFSGLDRIEVFENASDVKQTYKNEEEIEITLTDEEYLAKLRERGFATLEEYAETLNFESKINPLGNLIYKQDFELGDLVTCVSKPWGIKIDVRITEITESYNQKSNDIDVTFGESLPSLMAQVNKKLKAR